MNGQLDLETRETDMMMVPNENQLPMYTPEQTRRERAEACMQAFERGLAAMRLEFQSMLQQAIPAGREHLEGQLRTFATRLEVFQHEFLAQLPQARNSQICGNHSMQVGEESWMAEVGGGLVIGGAALTALLVPVIATTVGHLWWTHTVMVSVGGVVAAAIGVPVAVVTGGAAVAAAVAGGFAIHKGLQDSRRRELETALMDRFRGEIEPKLRNWARQAVYEALEVAA